jgi:hypothetical protein
VSAPRWGEPGYRPPVPRPQASRGHQWALWGALALGLVGQAAYLWSIDGGTSTGGTATDNGNCSTGPLFADPWLALAGFLAAVAAVVVTRRGRHPLQGFSRFGIVIATLTGLNVGWLALLPLGGACW